MTVNLVAIHQSNLFPRIKVLTKLATADLYLVQNDVQYVRNDWQNRFEVERRPGVRSLISVPVHRPHGRATLLSQARLVDSETSMRKLQDSIRHTYRREPFWRDVEDYLEEVLAAPVIYLADLAGRSTATALRRVAPEVAIREYPTLPVHVADLDRSWRLAAATKVVAGSAYLSGSGGRRYVNVEAFADEGIDVYWQDWESDADLLNLASGPVRSNNLSVLHYVASAGFGELKRAFRSLKGERRRRWDKAQ